MIKSILPSSIKAAQSWILLGIPILFIIGSILHFVYEWSGNSMIVGIFSPINESVWEHLKMTFWPMLIWWIVGYFRLSKRNKISPIQWFVSCAVAEVTSMLFIVSFYYTYTGAFGIESLPIDILSLFLGIATGQLMALHIYKYAKLSGRSLLVAILILIILVLAFVIFTFEPPNIPLFIDSSSDDVFFNTF